MIGSGGDGCGRDETSRSATEARLLGLEAEQALASQAGEQAGDWITSDPDCASERLFRNYTPHRMRVIGPPRDFRMRLRVGWSGSMALLRFNTGVELSQVPTGRFILVTTQVSGWSEIDTQAQSFSGGPGLMVVDSARSPVRKRFSADSERLHLRLGTAALDSLYERLVGKAPARPLEFAPCIRPGTAMQARWRSVVRMVLSCTAPSGGPSSTGPDAAGHPALPDFLRRQLEETAMLMLLTGHEHNGTEQMAGTPAAAAPRHVRAAEEFMRANAGESLTLAEIAEAAGVSIRTLTAGFRSFRDQSPMQQLRDIRMAAARDDLLQGPETGSTRTGGVADIALRWGFGNFGRFAGDYRRRYGETPSETLRRRA
ncbi:AraC-like DNA-binding protein [Azospirillum agricola]|uniref:AraC family transcriptional regulator n=1 Tax=Azospirillum agricola TaxID=1720247 RepID=UPI001AE2534C|nr:AraC family transcriptional regulator [Azospirillum agricola]MBP2232439.1 AraC-like DNA-binding protein [Azospirillum agricola]